jgi:RNA polymerase sigma factor (sigma-70 family)
MQAPGHQMPCLLVKGEYSSLLLRQITHLVRDEHLAHDVLQHVFLQLYRSLPTLRTGGTLKGWLCQVARNRCLDELRRKRPVFFSETALVSDGVEHSPLLMLPDPHPQPRSWSSCEICASCCSKLSIYCPRVPARSC